MRKMITDYLRLSMNNLKKRRLRTLLTIMGIFIGVATVVSLLSLGQGMKDAITAQFSSLGSDTISVKPKGRLGPIMAKTNTGITTRDLREIKSTKGVKQAFGRIIEPVRIKVEGKQTFSYIIGLPNDNEEFELAMKIPTELEIIKGTQLKLDDQCNLLIGNTLQKKPVMIKKLTVGDKIIIEGVKAKIVGVLKKTGNPQLDKTLFATEKCVRRITGEEEKYSMIIAKINPGKKINNVIERIKKNLRKLKGEKEGKESFDVQSSQEVVRSVNSILSAVNWFLIGIAAISLLVGVVGIMNTMYTSILERTREIGVMKAIGAKNSDVMTIFLIESGFLGLAGGTIGVTIGLSLSFLLSFIARNFAGFSLLQVDYSPTLIIGSLLFSLILGIISGVLPARQAAKLPPVEALRNG